MLLAGLEAPDTLVAELAGLLRTKGLEETADTLENALADGTVFVSLAPGDRDAILQALEDCPYGLAELETVVLLQSTWGAEPALAGQLAD
ncbi:hypothetical protein [Gaiella sp.]|uniref:hypothetical protein n=1 Tax=Gaiella sp. TaxID=2663207 RepID=UPI002E300A4E|nr:hypothetical protein [Gaiella sp.]HEX5582977.1 hypothetical protein [Gaiella sp.]